MIISVALGGAGTFILVGIMEPPIIGCCSLEVPSQLGALSEANAC